MKQETYECDLCFEITHYPRSNIAFLSVKLFTEKEALELTLCRKCYEKLMKWISNTIEGESEQ